MNRDRTVHVLHRPRPETRFESSCKTNQSQHERKSRDIVVADGPDTHASLPALANRSPDPTEESSLASARTACVCPVNVRRALFPFHSLTRLSAAPDK